MSHYIHAVSNSFIMLEDVLKPIVKKEKNNASRKMFKPWAPFPANVVIVLEIEKI